MGYWRDGELMSRMNALLKPLFQVHGNNKCYPLSLSKNEKSRPVVGGLAGVTVSRVRVKLSQRFCIRSEKVRH